MATAWPLTAQQIAHSAARELGIVSMGMELEDSEWEEILLRLNGMLQTWAVEGLMFRESSARLVIPAGVDVVELPQDVRDIRSARLVVSPTNFRAMQVWNRDQFYAFPNRVQSGLPIGVYYQQGADADFLKVWPVPTVDIELEVDASRRPLIVETATDVVDLPQDWAEAVIYGLASRIANMFGASKLDPAAVQRVDARAGQLYQRLLDADRPDSYFFEPYAERCC